MEEMMKEIMEVEEIGDITFDDYRVIAHHWGNRTVFTLDGKWVMTITRVPNSIGGYAEATEWPDDETLIGG